MRILGVDPSLNTTGYGVIDIDGGVPRVVEAGFVRTDSSQSLEQRILKIYEGISEVLEAQSPDAMAVEELYSSYRNPKTALLMAHARGCILLAASRRGIPVASYLPTRVKMAVTGNGRASKEQVASAVCFHLSLSERPTPADVTDALAAALCHAHTLRDHTC